MKAIKLYSSFVSEAVIEGKESIPAVEIGDDEFIELDEHGKPTKKTKAQKELAKKVTTKKKKITSINKKLADEDIKLSKDNNIIAEVKTDDFGDFKIDQLDPNSGKYKIDIKYKASKKSIWIFNFVFIFNFLVIYN